MAALLLRKYHKEKWVLSPKQIWKIHDSMGTQYKKFHAPGVEKKLSSTKNDLWFALKSGIFFDRHGFLMVGDSMDELNIRYQLTTSLRDRFLSVEGYTLYYRNEDKVKKMTLSGPEMKFLMEYVDMCDEWLNPEPWDWEEITDL